MPELLKLDIGLGGEELIFPERCILECPQIARWKRSLVSTNERFQLEAEIKLRGLSTMACAYSCEGPWDDSAEMAPVLYCSGNPDSMYGV